MSAIKREEEHKARILFAIIAAFAAFNMPRFVLNFEELLASRDYAFSLRRGCMAHPAWALILNHCSELAICANASLGFVVYCVMSTDFRYFFLKKTLGKHIFLIFFTFRDELCARIRVFISAFRRKATGTGGAGREQGDSTVASTANNSMGGGNSSADSRKRRWPPLLWCKDKRKDLNSSASSV